MPISDHVKLNCMVRTSGKFVIAVIALVAVQLSVLAPATLAAAVPFVVDVTALDVTKVKVARAPTVGGVPPDSRSQFLRITADYTVSPTEPASNKAGGYAKQPSQWLDECAFSWRVLFVRASDKGQKPTSEGAVLFEKEVLYQDIKVSQKPGARAKRAVIYVEPQVLERYGSDLIKDGVVVDLKISSSGAELAHVWATEKRIAAAAKTPQGFFPGSKDWFSSKKIKRLPYGLLDRSETPWEWSSYRSYEAIKKK